MSKFERKLSWFTSGALDWYQDWCCLKNNLLSDRILTFSSGWRGETLTLVVLSKEFLTNNEFSNEFLCSMH